MYQYTVCRRLVAVVLVVACLLVLPAAPALAVDGDAGGEAQAAQSEGSGLIQEVVDWLIDLVSTEEGDSAPDMDPMG